MGAAPVCSLRLVEQGRRQLDTLDIIEQAREVIAATLGLDVAAVPDDASPATLPVWDSLHHLTLIVTLEDRFKTTYSSDEIPEMNSLDAIARVTAQHVQLAPTA
jgi:acyl carrier protein